MKENNIQNQIDQIDNKIQRLEAQKEYLQKLLNLKIQEKEK